MISLFAKKDASSEARDQYGRWTVGAQGNANAGRAYAHWKVHETSTVRAMVSDARKHAGKRGELLRRKVFEANAREFMRRGLDKVKSQRKRLNSLFDIHSANMGLVSPEEQSHARAAMFAHALQHNEGPLGRLTPAYRDFVQRRVRAAIGEEGKKMQAAMNARKPRASRAKIAKYNQDHDELGRFTGPGDSHDPTGNPRGRPATGDKPSLGRTIAHAGITAVGEGLGGAAGAAAARGLGGLAGGTAGALVGGPVGEWGGAILGGLAGDYVASKIGEALLGIKEQMDGHAVGEGTAIGAIATEAAAMGASRLLPGGSAVRQLLSPLNFSTGAELTQAGVAGAGGLAGGVIGSKVGGGNAKMKKGLFDAPPKSYDGSFGTIAGQAMPHIFGPRAWKSIAGTKFGDYVRQKVKDAADKMDDAADAKGVNLQPAPPRQIGTARQAVQEGQERQQQDQQQTMMNHEREMARASTPSVVVQGGAGPPANQKPPVKKSLFGKAVTLPMRGPNDVVYRDAQQTGGAVNAGFIARMQESERKSRAAQQQVAFMQPKMENLAQKPGEDEQQYRQRVQQLMAQSVKLTDRLRPYLFAGGGETGSQKPVYRVRKVAPAPANDDDSGEDAWKISAEIAKEFNTEDRLKQGLVYGWASIIEKDGQVVTDHQGDRISPDELVKAAHDFVSNSRQGGVLHDEYGHKIGRIVESVVFTKELQDHLGIDLGKIGWLIGYKITDARVKTLVKSGLLKSFSIGGRGRRERVKDAA